MTTRIAFIDLDGVVADNTARFAKAEEAKQAYLAEQDMEDAVKHHGVNYIEGEATNLYWQTAFTPELVALDTLIEGAIDAMAMLAFNGYEVIILTSRPESMREATRHWLFEEGYPVEQPIIMKAPAFQYTKTTVWKAGIVQTLAALYGANEVLFVDDEETNCIAVRMDYGQRSYKLIDFYSLAEVIEKL